MRKKRLIVVLFIVLLLILAFFIFCFLIVRGYIPFRSYTQYNFFYKNIYSRLNLDKWNDKTLSQMRVITNYPCAYYFVKKTDEINSNIKLTLKTGPLLYFVDYDYSILFAFAKPNILDDFEKRNKPNIIDENSYSKHIGKADMRGIIDRIVLLKVGDLWNEPYYSNIYIKLYNNGEAIFNYIWHDRNKIADYHEWKLNKISIRIPIEKDYVLRKVDLAQLSHFYKMPTLETKLFGTILGADAMIIKNSDEVKILCRDPGSFKVNKEIRNYWGEVIIKSGLAENLIDVINSQETIPLEEWQLKYIIDGLNYFIK